MGKITKQELSNGLKAEIESKVKEDEFQSHSDRHEQGGDDEINLEDLQGESAELKSHKAENMPHQDSEKLKASQEIEVTSINSATSPINAPLKTAGGIGIAKNIIFGTSIGSEKYSAVSVPSIQIPDNNKLKIKMKSSFNSSTMIKVSFSTIRGDKSSFNRSIMFELVLGVAFTDPSSGAITVMKKDIYTSGTSADNIYAEVLGSDYEFELIVESTTGFSHSKICCFLEFIGDGVTYISREVEPI